MKYLPAVASGPLTLDTVHHCDALTLLRALPYASVDAVITDPPYAEVDRDYGRISEADWMKLAKGCVAEFRRVLKPHGSAMMILQPNSEHIGMMRPWLWDFMSWLSHEWNIVQDVYWWNFTKAPTAHANREHGLMRPSLKYCIWMGNPDCYRNQDAILWYPSDATFAENLENRALQYRPSGMSQRAGRMAATAIERGGSTPFNLLPMANTESTDSGGAHGHGAATPKRLAQWWIKYITRPGDLVCDPFVGSGTTAIAARGLDRHYIGCDSSSEHIATCKARLTAPHTPSMFLDPPAVAPTQAALFEVER